MAMKRLFKCDLCGQHFWWKMEYRSDPNPETCPICNGTGNALPKKPELLPEGFGAPSLMTDGNKVPDKLYRSHEAASQDRAYAAAALAGVDVSEMSSLKITNQADNMRDGDIAYVAQTTTEQRDMAANARTLSFDPRTAVQGAEYAAATRTGPEPYAGKRIMDRVRQNHSRERIAGMARGNLGVVKGGKS